VTAAALDAGGGCAWFLGDADRALHLFERGLAIYRELDDRQGMGVMLNRLGPPLAALGRDEESGSVVAEAASIHRDLGNKPELALSLQILGARAFEHGDVQTAIELLEESAAVARESGDMHMLAYALANLAEGALVGSDLETANRYSIEHLALARELGDNVQLIFGLAVRAIVVVRSGDEERAGALWGAAERLDVQLGETMWRNERHHYDELLGERGPLFEQGLEAGAKLSLEQAVELGLAP
jgi:tetratricopeptide (TPR) repeat protein